MASAQGLVEMVGEEGNPLKNLWVLWVQPTPVIDVGLLTSFAKVHALDSLGVYRSDRDMRMAYT